MYGTVELFVHYLIICKLLVHGYWLIGHSKTRRGMKEESETFPTATLLPCCHQLWTIYLATKHEPTMKLNDLFSILERAKTNGFTFLNAIIYNLKLDCQLKA